MERCNQCYCLASMWPRVHWEAGGENQPGHPSVQTGGQQPPPKGSQKPLLAELWARSPSYRSLPPKTDEHIENTSRMNRRNESTWISHKRGLVPLNMVSAGRQWWQVSLRNKDSHDEAVRSDVSKAMLVCTLR